MLHRNEAAVELTAEERNRIAGTARRLYQHYADVADREDIERRLTFAAEYAHRAFDPTLGMPFDEFGKLCIDNCARHIARSLKPIAETARRTDSLDDSDLCGVWTRGDRLNDHRNGPEHILRVLAIRAWLDRLTGISWLVGIAHLCGYRFSEIARKLGIARSSFDRKFGPIFAALREEGDDAA